MVLAAVAFASSLLPAPFSRLPTQAVNLNPIAAVP